MTVFIDASVMVAIIACEPDHQRLLDRLSEHRSAICGPVTLWETLAALCKSYRYTPASARAAISDFCQTLEVSLVPIGQAETDLAMTSYERYGKGRHPAALNLGNCFAYACARTNNATLLYKADDFAKTDLA